MNEHEELQLDLAAYSASRLRGESLERLEEHLAQCEVCRDMADTLQQFGATLREGGEWLFEAHPGYSALRAFARGLEGGANDSIARHLEICTACALEVEMWRRRSRAHADAGAPTAPARLPSLSFTALACAVSLVLGIGLGVLLRDALAPPTPRSRAGALLGEETHPSAGALLLLPRALRGEGTAVSYLFDPKQEFVVLTCPASVPEQAVPEERFRYEIRGADGRVVWSLDLSAGAIRKHLAAEAEVVTLLVPTRSLQSGRFEFSVRRTDGSGEPLYRIELDLTESQ